MGGTADGFSFAEGKSSLHAASASPWVFFTEAGTTLWSIDPVSSSHFHALDRETDTTPVVLLAASSPFSPIKLHSVASRETWCDRFFPNIMSMVSIYSAVSGFASMNTTQRSRANLVVVVLLDGSP